MKVSCSVRPQAATKLGIQLIEKVHTLVESLAPPRQEQSAWRGRRPGLFFHPASQTLIATDLLFNLGPSRLRGALTPWILRATGAYGRPAQSRLLRLLTKDRTRAARALQQALDWPFVRILMAHGDPITEDARGTLRTACRWMLAAQEG